MFSKTNGPTALRSDLVRSLSFSRDRIERLRAGATVSSLAALAAVWNGHKGHVALVVRDIDPAAIERYESSTPIASEADLDAVVEEGLAFAESLGFSMDVPEFLILSRGDRDARLYRWNRLRKLRQPSPVIPAHEATELALSPTGDEIELEELAQRAPSAAPALDTPGALLGRISLVNRDSADSQRLELLARLLAYY